MGPLCLTPCVSRARRQQEHRLDAKVVERFRVDRFLRLRLKAAARHVSLVGSYNANAMHMELYLRVRAWEAGRRSTGVEVELVD
jgi:hypothetical protein